ncbi:MAG: hypothetical protein IJG31_04860 [Fusobacterium sp.]|nr:hypothetical protein [Fusobacterium sp.]
MKKITIFILSILLLISCGKTNETNKNDITITEAENYKYYVKLYDTLLFKGIPFSDSYLLFFDKDLNYIGLTSDNFNQVNLDKINEQYEDYEIIFKNIREKLDRSSKHELDKKVIKVLEFSDNSKNKLSELVSYLYDASFKDDSKIENLNEDFLMFYEKNLESSIYFMSEIEEISFQSQEKLLENIKKHGSTIEEKIENFKLAAEIFISTFYNFKNLNNLKNNNEVLINLENLHYLLNIAKADVINEFNKYDDAKNYKEIYLNYFENIEKISHDLMFCVKNDENIEKILDKIALFSEIYSRNIKNKELSIKTE